MWSICERELAIVLVPKSLTFKEDTYQLSNVGQASLLCRASVPPVYKGNENFIIQICRDSRR